MNNNQPGVGKDKGAQGAGTVATENPGHAAAAGERVEVGDAASSRRHPPHVTENDQGAPLQENQERPGDIAARPPNASGRETVSADEYAEAHEVDPESAYNRRPSEHKDVPPGR